MKYKIKYSNKINYYLSVNYYFKLLLMHCQGVFPSLFVIVSLAPFLIKISAISKCW